MHEEEVAFAIIIGTLLFLFLCICLLLFFVLFKNSKKRHFEEKKRLELSYKNELANATIEIQENTLLNVSRELHDNVGQLLTVAKIHLNSLVKYPEKRTDEKITETGNVVELAINELRALSKSLNTDKIKQLGVVYALRMELERINKLEVIKSYSAIEGSPYPMGEDIEIIIFRIIQEFIANTIKYAEATRLEVRLNYAPHKFRLEIKDDGKGFDVSDQKNVGSGILNIKNRAALISAECQFHSGLNEGTTLILSINKEEAVAAD